MTAVTGGDDMADTAPDSADESAREKADDKAGEKDKTVEPTDDLVTTRHSLTIGDRELGYTASAGRIVLRQESHTDDKFDGNKPKAEVFLTAYVADVPDSRQRPVTFAFNGGPGSASVWLHLGLLGPRRVLMGDAGQLLPPPYDIADNAESLLAHSDLVFIDPISTGYSRATKGEKPKDFHGYTGDIETVAEVIRLWTSRNGRWMSPKYLCGESYGTLRAAGLARHLQERYGHVPQRPHAHLTRDRRRNARVQWPQRRPVPLVPAHLRGDRALPRPARRPSVARGGGRSRGVRR
jgi:carboxypeptidase C (cathepsin A)